MCRGLQAWDDSRGLRKEAQDDARCRRDISVSEGPRMGEEWPWSPPQVRLGEGVIEALEELARDEQRDVDGWWVVVG